MVSPSAPIAGKESLFRGSPAVCRPLGQAGAERGLKLPRCIPIWGWGAGGLRGLTPLVVHGQLHFSRPAD